jgi:hypothetical protein
MYVYSLGVGRNSTVGCRIKESHPNSLRLSELDGIGLGLTLQETHDTLGPKKQRFPDGFLHFFF